MHVGHSTGGGEVARYIARHGESRVAKAVLINAVPPLMVKTAANPGGLPKEVFDECRRRSPTHRSQFYLRLRGRPVLRLQPPGRQGLTRRHPELVAQGMMGGAKAHYDGIVAFSQTDFTEDLKKIDVPVLVMHGDDDQIVPYRRFGAAIGKAGEERHVEDLQGFPHGMPTTQAETINADLLAFIKE